MKLIKNYEGRVFFIRDLLNFKYSVGSDGNARILMRFSNQDSDYLTAGEPSFVYGEFERFVSYLATDEKPIFEVRIDIQQAIENCNKEAEAQND